MRLKCFALAGALALGASAASAQSVAELRAQYQETMNLLNQAESMGVDPGMLASLRESLEGLRQSIEEQERDEAAAASAPVEEPAAPLPPAPAANLEPNLAASTCGDFGITEGNYRQAALAPGGDVQMKTLCGQAMEFYSMYKRAMAQQHPEAWRTYDAHKAASMQLGAFDRDTRAGPSEAFNPTPRRPCKCKPNARPSKRNPRLKRRMSRARRRPRPAKAV